MQTALIFHLIHLFPERPAFQVSNKSSNTAITTRVSTEVNIKQLVLFKWCCILIHLCFVPQTYRKKSTWIRQEQEVAVETLPRDSLLMIFVDTNDSWVVINGFPLKKENSSMPSNLQPPGHKTQDFHLQLLFLNAQLLVNTSADTHPFPTNTWVGFCSAPAFHAEGSPAFPRDPSGNLCPLPQAPPFPLCPLPLVMPGVQDKLYLNFCPDFLSCRLHTSSCRQFICSFIFLISTLPSSFILGNSGVFLKKTSFYHLIITCLAMLFSQFHFVPPSPF